MWYEIHNLSMRGSPVFERQQRFSEPVPHKRQQLPPSLTKSALPQQLRHQNHQRYRRLMHLILPCSSDEKQGNSCYPVGKKVAETVAWESAYRAKKREARGQSSRVMADSQSSSMPVTTSASSTLMERKKNA
ncbi:MAG: hypothetical protein FJ147_26425 [Deltaproteobacteria bacterium]|nr:hypothetical protein [Deltaproteobacteria bacterium]